MFHKHMSLDLLLFYICYQLLFCYHLKGQDYLSVFYTFIYGPRREKTCLRELANNTGADQPAHPRSLISDFVIRFLERIICKLGTGEISIF